MPDQSTTIPKYNTGDRPAFIGGHFIPACTVFETDGPPSKTWIPLNEPAQEALAAVRERIATQPPPLSPRAREFQAALAQMFGLERHPVPERPSLQDALAIVASEHGLTPEQMQELRAGLADMEKEAEAKRKRGVRPEPSTFSEATANTPRTPGNAPVAMSALVRPDDHAEQHHKGKGKGKDGEK